jgi:hypothetical protein
MPKCWVKDSDKKPYVSLTIIVPEGDPQEPYLDFCKDHYYEVTKKLNLNKP